MAGEQQRLKGKKPTHRAYYIKENGEKSFWMPCGAAWVHRDGKGFRIKLDAMPIDGVVELRMIEAKKEAPAEAGVAPDPEAVPY